MALHEALRKSKQETLAVLESVYLSLPYLFSELAMVEQLEAQTRVEWERALQLLEDEQRAGELAREISRSSLEELKRMSSSYESQMEQMRVCTLCLVW
jgi:hypothetical protein